jgi:C4-dicarboxylate transporter DctM subunit
MGLTLLFLIIFSVLCVVGYPIAFTMIIGGIIYFLSSGLNPAQLMDTMAIQLQSNYVLISIPMFVFAANVMNETEITDRMFDFVKKALGPIRGSLAQANIVTSVIFAGMSGSEIADIAGPGSIEIKAMKNAGYDMPFSCAVTCASSVIGPLIPPSIPMIMYSALTGTSIGFLFLAGFMPGILLAGIEMALVYFLARKRNYPVEPRSTFAAIFKSFFVSFSALLAPLLLLISIYTGICSVTESAAVLSAYIIVIGFFVYRTLGMEKLVKVTIKSVENIGYIGILIAAAFVMSFIISREEIAQQVTNFVLHSSFITSKWSFLFFANLLYFILGMFVNTTTIQLVVIPILFPLATVFGVDPVHFGAISVMNLMIGMNTPPYGTACFVISGITRTPINQIFKEMLKSWIPIEVFGLLMVTYFPDIILWIPRMFGYQG